jgi:hypothetical protein
LTPDSQVLLPAFPRASLAADDKNNIEEIDVSYRLDLADSG